MCIKYFGAQRGTYKYVTVLRAGELEEHRRRVTRHGKQEKWVWNTRPHTNSLQMAYCSGRCRNIAPMAGLSEISVSLFD